MEAGHPRQERSPLRTIIGCVAGSDGLIYEVLECQHRVLLMAGPFGYIVTNRRRCPICPRSARRRPSKQTDRPVR